MPLITGGYQYIYIYSPCDVDVLLNFLFDDAYWIRAIGIYIRFKVEEHLLTFSEYIPYGLARHSETGSTVMYTNPRALIGHRGTIYGAYVSGRSAHKGANQHRERPTALGDGVNSRLFE